MQWIRISVKMKSDPAIDRIAAHCGVRLSEIVGCVTNLLCEFPEHALAGDLAGISDSALERWAVWEGKRGLFAQAFRSEMCAGHQVKAWDKHNGAAIRESLRKRKGRGDLTETGAAPREDYALPDDAPTENEPDKPRNTRGNSAPNPGSVPENPRLRNVTVRNGEDSESEVIPNSNNIAPTASSPPKAVRSKPAPKPPQFPHFEKARCDAMHEYWLQRVGGVNYGRFRRAFGEVFCRSDADRPEGALSHDQLQDAFEHWCLSVSRGTSSPFATPEKCAQQVSAVAQAVKRNVGNDLAIDRAVDVIVHGRAVGASA